MTSRIRIQFLLALLVMQVITVTAIVVGAQLTVEPALRDQMSRLLVQTAEGAARQTTAELAIPAQTALFTANLIALGAIDGTDDESLDVRFTERLRLNPQMAGLYYGRADGSYVFVKRDDERPGAVTRTKIIDVGPDGTRTVRLVWRDAQDVVVADELDPTDTFDPRARPWYQMASEAESLVWTDPYVFFTDQKPGVTTAAPVVSSDGTTAGVVGVDVGLEELAFVVDRLEITPNGAAMIVTASGQVVAFPDPEVLVVDSEDGEPRLITVDELNGAATDADGEAMAQAYDALEASGAVSADGPGNAALPAEERTVTVEIDGTGYQAASSALFAPEGWHLVVEAPEDDFVAEVRDAERRNALLAVAIAFLVVLAAFPIITIAARKVTRLQHRADNDALTGLANRHVFDRRLTEAVEQSRRTGKPLSAAQLDVDHFKSVNDTHGHAAGDEALKVVARRLEHGVRSGDLVARLGGDEFAVLLTDADEHEAGEILERIRAAVEAEPVGTEGANIPITITVGVADLAGLTGGVDAAGEEADGDGAGLLQRADEALYVAKEAGRNQVATCDGVLSGNPLPPRDPRGPEVPEGPGDPGAQPEPHAAR